MSQFMLDTNICVEVIRGRASRVFGRLRQQGVDNVAISSITLAELQYGVVKSERPEQNAMLLAKFCAPLAILPFDSQSAEAYGGIRTALEKNGKPIGSLDTLIAAHAMSLGITLITNNEREFRRVDGLRIENWVVK